MKWLRHVIEGIDTWQGRAFDIFIQLLIVISLLTFSLETLPGLSPGQREVLRTAEFVTVMIFTAEYVARVACAANRTGFIFSFFGLIDLLAILPFYLTTGVHQIGSTPKDTVCRAARGLHIVFARKRLVGNQLHFRRL